MAINFWKTGNRRLVNDFASEENCKQSFCKRGQIPMKGKLRHTRVPERLMDPSTRNQLGGTEESTGSHLYMEGFIPYPFPQAGTCLFAPWRNGKLLDSEIPGTTQVLGEDQGEDREMK